MSEDADCDRTRGNGDRKRESDSGSDAESDLPTDDAPAPEEAFEEGEYEDVDAEEVWTGVESAEEEANAVPPTAEDAADEAEIPEESLDGAAEPTAEGESEGGGEDLAVNVIESRICRNCPYFGEPPELHCTHEGTEIREVVDTDHYIVVDCPVVADEQEF